MSPDTSPKIDEQKVAELLRAGYSSLQNADNTTAIERFNACLLEEPGLAPALEGRGAAHFKLEQWPEAEADFAEVLKAAPGNSEARLGYALCLIRQESVPKGLDLMESLVAEEPNFVRARINLATLYFKLGVPKKGREQMAEAQKRHPSPEQRHEIDSCLKEQNKLDQKRIYRPDFQALKLKDRFAGFFGKRS